MTGQRRLVRLRFVARVVTWLALLGTLLWAGHGPGARRLPIPGLPEWPDAVVDDPARFVAAMARGAALAWCWYLVVVTVTATLTHLRGSTPGRPTRPGAPARAAAGWGRRRRPGAGRRLVAGALGLTIGLGPASWAAAGPPPGRAAATAPAGAGTAGAGAGPPGSAPHHDTPAGATLRLLGGAATEEASTARLSVLPGQPMPPPSPTTWTVRAGDHFWSIATQVLAGDDATPPAPRAVAHYWRRLVEANRAGLADPANPDLLFRGQVLTLPDPGPSRAGPGATSAQVQ